MADPPRPDSLAPPQQHPHARAVRNYRLALGAAALVIALLVILRVADHSRSRQARTITIDGQPVCFVKNQAAARSVREALLRAGKGSLPGKATFAQRWEEAAVSSCDQQPLAVQDAAQLIQPRVTVLVEAAVVMVNGKPTVKLASPDLARQVLEAVKALYVREGERIRSQDFRESVAVPIVATPAAEITSDVSGAVARLVRAKREAETYAVKAGDVPDKIAAQHGMKLAELYALNPGLKGRDISAGELLKVSTPRPLLTVVTVKDVARIETFDAPPERVSNPCLPKGQETVERQGVPGERTIHEQQTCENRRITKHTILQQNTTKQAVPKKISVGMGSAPTKGH